MSSLMLYEATGTREGSKSYQGSEPVGAHQETEDIVKVPFEDFEMRNYTIEVTEDRLRTRITVGLH